jgi:hypothetical protein
MGSHGGATAQGQAEVLRLYGISEDAIGVPVRATMDVVELPSSGLPIRIFADRTPMKLTASSDQQSEAAHRLSRAIRSGL